MVREETPSSGADGVRPEARNVLTGLAELNERTSGAVIARLLSDHSASTAEVHRANARPMDLGPAHLDAAVLSTITLAAQCLPILNTYGRAPPDPIGSDSFWVNKLQLGRA